MKPASPLLSMSALLLSVMPLLFLLPVAGAKLPRRPLERCIIACYIGWPDEFDDCVYEWRERDARCVPCIETLKQTCRPMSVPIRLTRSSAPLQNQSRRNFRKTSTGTRQTMNSWLPSIRSTVSLST